MNKKLRWIIIGLVSAIVILLILKKLDVFTTDEGIKVTTEKVTHRKITEIVSTNGKVFPEIEVKVSSDISGEVTQLNVEEGDSIKKGQVLARIYADIYNSQRDQAAAEVNRVQANVNNSSAALDAFKAHLEQAKVNYDRQKSLLDEKVISKLEFEQVDNNYKTALSDYNAAKQTIRSGEAGVSSARAVLVKANKDVSRAVIIAPMDGIISSLSVKKGEKVVGTAQMAGTEIMRIADMSTMEIRVEVGENDIPKVKIGDSASITIDAYSNRKFVGIITKIAASSNATNNVSSNSMSSTNQATTYLVNVRLVKESYQDLITNTSKNKFPFRPGMNASVDIFTETHNTVLAIPINAVTTRSDSELVFIVQKDKTVKPVMVKTSIQDMNYIEITTGLKEGDEIVVGPYNIVSKQLKEGTKIKVVAKEKLFENE